MQIEAEMNINLWLWCRWALDMQMMIHRCLWDTGHAFIILTRGAVASAWTLSLKQGRTQFSLRRQKPRRRCQHRTSGKTPHSNLSKQIWEDEFLNKGDKIEHMLWLPAAHRDRQPKKMDLRHDGNGGLSQHEEKKSKSRYKENAGKHLSARIMCSFQALIH